MLKGRGPEQCGMLGTCNLQCIVEADGSIYPCDFYVLDEFKLGNIHEDRLVNIYQPSRAKAFFDYEEAKHPLCDSCKVYPICTGGCKRYRTFYSREKDYCPYQDFLYNSFDKMQEVARVVG
ncbi:MAG: SPASM domain-containing protein, partial [Clostridiales bacterium]|nr:SPASM domain-containing protein [Clostridiales bacterium]